MTEKEIIIQITRYINDDLNDREEDQLWVEFLNNPHYYHLFETELNLADLYQNKKFRLNEDDGIVREPVRRYKVWIMAAAATILLAAVLFLYTFRLADAPSGYALSSIDTTELLGGEVLRSDEAGESPEADREMNRAVALALEGENERAQQELLSLLEQTGTDVQELRIRYNLGILAYNDRNYDQAADYFTGVLQYGFDLGDEKYITENSRWYMANIYLRQGETERAVSELEELIAEESVHAADAAQLLNRIRS